MGGGDNGITGESQCVPEFQIRNPKRGQGFLPSDGLGARVLNEVQETSCRESEGVPQSHFSVGVSIQDCPKACQVLVELSSTEDLSTVIAALHLQGLQTDYYLVYDLSLVFLGLSSAFDFSLQCQQTMQYAFVAL